MSIVVTGANRHDVTQVEAVLKNRVRKPRGRTQQNLCADAGYSGEKSEVVMKKYRYIPHIRPRGEEKVAIQHGYKARRWIVVNVQAQSGQEFFQCYLLVQRVGSKTLPMTFIPETMKKVRESVSATDRNGLSKFGKKQDLAEC